MPTEPQPNAALKGQLKSGTGNVRTCLNQVRATSVPTQIR